MAEWLFCLPLVTDSFHRPENLNHFHHVIGLANLWDSINVLMSHIIFFKPKNHMNLTRCLFFKYFEKTGEGLWNFIMYNILWGTQIFLSDSMYKYFIFFLQNNIWFCMFLIRYFQLITIPCFFFGANFQEFSLFISQFIIHFTVIKQRT